MKVAVIGAGSWGTALSIKAFQSGNETYLYHREKDKAEYMMREHRNPDYLKHVNLPKEIVVTNSYEEAMKNASIVLLVTPSQYVRETLIALKKYLSKDMYLVCCSKGLEKSTGMRMSQVMSQVVGNITEHISILSGPNHAEEIAIDKPASTVIGTSSIEDGEYIQRALSSSLFRVYTNTDIIGVELGGTTKNIIALAAGIVYAMNLGDNTLAALMTRGLHEITRFGLAYGAQRETYAGLAGMGDLIATCMSSNSRNRKAGIELAKGRTMTMIQEESNMVVEGFFAVLAVYEEAKKKNITMPITGALRKVLLGEQTPKEALFDLMNRELKNEIHLL